MLMNLVCALLIISGLIIVVRNTFIFLRIRATFVNKNHIDTMFVADNFYSYILTFRD